VAESVRPWLPRPELGKLEYLVQTVPPIVDDAVEQLAAANHERLVAEFFGPAISRSRSHLRPGEDITSVLFLPSEKSRCPEPLHVKRTHRKIRKPVYVMSQMKSLNLRSPNAAPCSVMPLLIVEVITGFDDVRQLLVCERDLLAARDEPIGGFRSGLTGDFEIHSAVRRKSEKRAKLFKHLALGANSTRCYRCKTRPCPSR